MSLIKFLTSRTFFIQAFLAIAIVVVFTFLVIQFLDFRTNHGQEIKVPDLSKMKLEIAEEKLNELDLEVFLLDTVEFNADFPPFTILEQDPKAGSLVKDGRKVYVKLNAGEFTDITIPEFKDKTFRQISATIKSLTLKEGKITYKPHIAKDIVLQIYQNGRRLRAGDKVKKNSTLDFVLGDGKEVFNEETFSSEEPADTLPPAEEGVTEPVEFKEDNGGL
ncbi:MAG: PASTA domain-containing protein [Flavobacterium sp.]|jgi:beta-lactam-binding protein with PASTA domain|uniref:PASTA domain-containing protein n=1 Tax=Flavobacterium sp. TaxID=239 RepID=UPI0029775C5A|nr:PASTA domain-containing protein [Flavobacterium sp.]TAF10725.1 MAG: PASTA domain-containing protein [Flavobacteriia bacterium]WRH73885.1 MAG: PASTA domain-containing protein [Flavobacterium sp.]